MTLQFGKVKNHLQKLKTYLIKMQFFSQEGQKITQKQLQQPNFRVANNEIFLPLINYILLEYSTDLYKKILDYTPNLKYLSDKSFIQNTIRISLKLLDVQANLTADQFLTDKYFEKKLQFIANLAKSVYERSQATKKMKGKQKQMTATVQTKIQKFDTNHYYNDNANSDFDDFEQQRPLQIKPKIINVQQLANNFRSNTSISSQSKQQNKFTNKQLKSLNTANLSKQAPSKNMTNYTNPINRNKFTVDGQQFEAEQVKRALQQALQQRQTTPVHRHPQSNTMNSRTKRPVDQPIRINQKYKTNSNNESQEEDTDKYDKYKLDENKPHNKVQTYHSNQPHKYKQQNYKSNPNNNNLQNSYTNTHNNCVSKQQFNQLVQLIKVVSQTVNQMSQKFGNLQNNMNIQINNMNARVMMLENSVRVLKDNL